jgi:hypothetical protein
MPGISMDQHYKINAMTKQLNEEIDWVSIRRRELADAAYALKKVSSAAYTNEVMISIMGEFEAER